MLVKCSECAREVSDAATACPNCGHPMGVTPSTAPSKVSHSAGWISLAAFMLANFTPAILAPIFVLVGLVFGSKEFTSDGKKFGALVLFLSLLQGWFVLDHFGHITGTLGLTTAKDVDSQASARYANVSIDLPADWRTIAKNKCEEEWPTDYKMQKYCVDQQADGAQALSASAPSDIDGSAFRVIRGKCTEEWPRDFKMRAYCENQQFAGYRSLQASASSNPIRNTCAQQWPNDYKMRQYCETKGR